MGTLFDGETRPLALVVDDDAFVRSEMAGMLDELGYAVEQADCVSAALSVLEDKGDRISVLLTDLAMPGSRNGVTLANHVSYIWPHIRIVVTSGAKHPIEGELPFAAQFIAKPLTPEALTACVAKFPSGPLLP